MTPVAVYVHIPFCPSKCGYCDFNSYAMEGPIVERTVEALVREVHGSPWRGRPAKTIFFGGGTPTFLSAAQLGRILAAVREVHPPVEGAEISSEANPGTVDAAKFDALRAMGFDRLSLGAQSFSSTDLVRLGRIHEATEIGRAVGAARRAGFRNLNLDLMFALPGQSLAAWKRNLELALALEPEHLSLYCLTIEPETRFYRLHLRGLLDLPDEEAQVRMYDLARDTAEAAGLRHYETSNFARPGFECRHNLAYWRGEEYLAYGPGAVGCYALPDGRRERYTVIKHPVRYVEAIERGLWPWFAREVLDEATLRRERVMLGIRLAEGVAWEDVAPGALPDLLDRGWITVSDGRVRLTREGRLFENEVAAALIEWEPSPARRAPEQVSSSTG